MKNKKIFRVSSTASGPFERGTCCIASTEHGFYFADSSEEAIVKAKVRHGITEDRDFKVRQYTHRVGDVKRLTEIKQGLEKELDATSQSLKEIKEFLGKGK